MIFTGLYHNVRFKFNVYVNSQGYVSQKAKQNPIWHKPVSLPGTLKDGIDEVVQRAKSIDGAGNVTAMQGHPDRRYE